MKNNRETFSDLTFQVQDDSSFIAIQTGALIPDAILKHYAVETPWFVKRAVEVLFFQGRELHELETREAADAFYINALIALQHDLKDLLGEADFEGMLKCYMMPDHYEEMFRSMVGIGFAEVYKNYRKNLGLHKNKVAGTTWNRNRGGISLN